MGLFQHTVLNKYLKEIDRQKIDEAWNIFTAHFHDPNIQQNIRQSKEEQYQGEFLIDLFVHVLGYTKNPAPDFNLSTEIKNLKGAKKADGAILQDNKAIAVIELKGTNTTDLSKVETQAFGYKHHQPECVYVVTSNFEKLRFYIDNAIDFEEFNLFQLSKKQFDILWLCLAADNLLKGIPKNIKNESLTQEENVTKKLYKDYAQFRSDIFNNIQHNNPQYDKLTLFKKTQKLLDRFLFILFAEDRLLLPPNSTQEIIRQWTNLKDDFDAYVPLYGRFKKYFGYLNNGYSGKKHDVFAYNGGLFAPDDILDSIKIDDELLYKHTLNLSNYDFESEISVNILGHIFEHSLNEIEEIQNELSATDPTKEEKKAIGKRKKDGVFYTPKYITKYIVDNTVGKLCEEKKTAFGIEETDYEKDPKGRRKATHQKLQDKLDSYREWLLQLSICDPACGSGAFLNQALEFLIAEHRYIDELEAKLMGGGIVLSNIEDSILENNLFGADINEESVEIAKLSLWLRTAQKGRKLTTLSNNIKCGNSLVDDPEIAGDKAFDWHKEFPQVFEEKKLEAFHVTWGTHNFKVSQRMIEHKVKHGESYWLTEKEEWQVTETMMEIIIEDKLNVMAYNICGNHIHLLIVCEEEEISNIVRKLKGKSSQKLKEYLNIDKEETFTLWAQKYNKVSIHSDKQLFNTIEYIVSNREKHGLPPLHSHKELNHKGLQPLVEKGGDTTNHKLHNEIDKDTGKGIEHKADNYHKADNSHKELKHKGLQPLVVQRAIVDYDTAFRPQYKGGFDVVIGNPPYLRIQGLKDAYPELTAYYEQNYTSATGNYDVYVLFLEKAFQLINKNGLASYIMPHKFLIADFGIGIRKFLKNNTAVKELVHFGSEIVFEEAATYTCIINLSKENKDTVLFKKTKPSELFEETQFNKMKYTNLSEKNWDLQSETIFSLIKKLKQQPYTVGDVFDKIFVGLQTSLDAVYVFRGEDKGSIVKGYNEKYNYHFEIEKDMVKPILGGKNIYKYYNSPITNYVIFPYIIDTDAAKPMDEKYVECNFPKAYTYLKHFEKEIKGREKGRMNINEGWFLYIYPKNLDKFQHPKIMTQEISLGCNMTYDEQGQYYHNTKVYSFVKNPTFKVNDKFYLGILNSKLMWFFLKNTGSEYRGGYYVFKTNYLKPFPLPEIPPNASEMIEKANQMLTLNAQVHQKKNKFLQRVKDNLDIEKPSQKLAAFYEHDFKTFVAEINKGFKSLVGKKLSLTGQDEWEEYFTAYKTDINQLQAEIDKTDHQINQMVYELYNLTEEEINIIEEN